MGRFTGKKCRLMSMFWLTAFFFMVELIFGYITNSMALVADSFHMLSDVAALVIAFLSIKMSPKKWSKNTFGWARAEVLGALVNAVFLVALCFSITVEACKRFIEKEQIHDPQYIVGVGTLGLLVNITGLFLFHGHGHMHSHSHGKSHHHDGNHSNSNDSTPTQNRAMLPTEAAKDDEVEVNSSGCCILGGFRRYLPAPIACEEGSIIRNHNHSHDHDDRNHHRELETGSSSMNMRGVFLHVLADALGSVVVIISSAIYWKTRWAYKDYIDPILSLIMVCIILKSVWPLLEESALILLQTVPTHIKIDVIQRRLLETVDGVIAVHEFHIWQLAGDRIIASAHIRCRNLSEYMKIAGKVKEFFHNEGIHSTTIQPEFVDGSDKTKDISNNFELFDSEECVLDCPKTNDKKSCISSTCCGPTKKDRDTPSTPLNTSTLLMPFYNKQGAAIIMEKMDNVNNNKDKVDASIIKEVGEDGMLLAATPPQADEQSERSMN